MSTASRLIGTLRFVTYFKLIISEISAILKNILGSLGRAGHYKTSWGHFALYGLSAHGLTTERARLAGGTSLRSWFQKKYLLPGGIFARGFKKSTCYLVGF